ncbi:MAG: hypothetical protein Q8L20_11085 [Gammaproteobacteria bacterium]|nr:hypothetical protein [Gammaproteobacteria bacterium]
MKATPMLMQGPLVLASLRNEKTHTRRLSGLESINAAPDMWSLLSAGRLDSEEHQHHGKYGATFSGPEYSVFVPCRYGAPGDLIWIKETFYAWGRWETRFSQKKERDEWHFVDMTLECGKEYRYAADGMFTSAKKNCVTPDWHMRPAIFMPRQVSRLTAQLISVRVERIQSITEAAAKAEGTKLTAQPQRSAAPLTYRLCFSHMWVQINGVNSWANNDWVFDLEYKAIAQNIDAVISKGEY